MHIELVVNTIPKYNFINDDIVIVFELSYTMQDLIDKAEKADILEDYGLYMNLADAIDSQAKKRSIKTFNY